MYGNLWGVAYRITDKWTSCDVELEWIFRGQRRFWSLDACSTQSWEALAGRVDELESMAEEAKSETSDAVCGFGFELCTFGEVFLRQYFFPRLVFPRVFESLRTQNIAYFCTHVAIK